MVESAIFCRILRVKGLNLGHVIGLRKVKKGKYKNFAGLVVIFLLCYNQVSEKGLPEVWKPLCMR